MTVTGPGGTWPNGWSSAGHQASTGIVWAAAAVRRAPGSPSEGVDCPTLPWVAKLVDIHLGRQAGRANQGTRQSMSTA